MFPSGSSASPVAFGTATMVGAQPSPLKPQPSHQSQQSLGGLQQRANQPNQHPTNNDPTMPQTTPTYAVSSPSSSSLPSSFHSPSRLTSPPTSTSSVEDDAQPQGITQSYIAHLPATLASAAVQRHASAAANAASTGKPVFLEFQYSSRIGLALLPAIAILIAAGGRPLITIACVGAIISYVIDSGGSPEGSFVCVWLSTIGCIISLTLSNNLKSYTMFAWLLLILLNTILCLIGLYISCHFSFLSRELLSRSGFFGQAERVLFGTLFLPLVTIEVLALFALGAESVPWMMCIVLIYNYYLLIRPLPSSEQLCDWGLDSKSEQMLKKKPMGGQQGKAAMTSKQVTIPLDDRDLVISHLVCGIYTVLSVLLPYWMFLSLHHSYLLSHIFSTEGFMLLTVQVLLLTLLQRSPEEFGWFTGLSSALLTPMKHTVLLASSLSFILLAEIRVVLPSPLGRHLALIHSWPVLGMVVLTLGVYAGVIALGLAYLGVEQNSAIRSKKSDDDDRGISSTLSASTSSDTRLLVFRVALHLSFFFLGLSFGFPWYSFPFVLLTATLLSHMFLTQDPLSFAVVAVVWSAAWWWVIRHLIGFLEYGIRLRTEVKHAGELMFSSQSLIIFIEATLSAVIPLGHVTVAYLVQMNTRLDQVGDGGERRSASDLSSIFPWLRPNLVHMFLYGLLDGLLCFYIFLLASIEWDCTRTDQRQVYDSSIYPWWLICFTSILVVFAAKEFGPNKRNKIAARTQWILYGLAFWKLGVLFADDQRDLYHFFLLVFTQVPLFFAYREEDSNASSIGYAVSRSSSFLTGDWRMQPWQGVAHILSIVLSMWLSKNTVLAHMLKWSGISSTASLNQMNESSYVGLFLVGTAIGIMPVTFRHFKTVPKYRRWNVLFFLLAVLFYSIQPRLSFLSLPGLGRLSSESDVFSLPLETRQPIWPQWVLFVAGSIAILTIGSVASASASSTAVLSSSTAGSSASGIVASLPRRVLALGLGSSLGIYLLGVYLPFHPLLYALMMAIFNLAALFIIELFLGGNKTVHTSPSATSFSSSSLSSLFLYFALFLPVTYLAIGWVYPLPRIHGIRETSSNTRMTREAEARLLYRSALLAVYTTLAFLLSLAVNLHRELSEMSQTKEARWKNIALYSLTGSGAIHHKTRDTLRAIGNYSCIFAMVTATYLHLAYMDGTLIGVFAIAPILLLITPAGIEDKKNDLKDYDSTHRWLPVVFGLIAVFVYSACLDLFLRSLLAYFSLVAPAPIRTAIRFWSWVGVKNFLLLLVTVPTIVRIVEMYRHITAAGKQQSSSRFNSSSLLSGGLSLLVLGPLLLLPLIFADLLAIQLLAVIGLGGTMIDAYRSHNKNRRGMRII